MSTTVLLVETNDILRKGLSCSLAASRRVERLIEAESIEQALGQLRQSRVRAAIIGTDVLAEGDSFVERVGAVSPGARCVVFAHDDSRLAIDRALGSGAAGLLGSGSSIEELWKALDAVLAQRTYVSPGFKQRLIDARRPDATEAAPCQLTKRERSVLQRIGEGESNKEIAAKLGVSQRTVDTHRARLMRKLGIHKTAGLVRYAVREGLVEA